MFVPLSVTPLIGYLANLLMTVGVITLIGKNRESRTCVKSTGLWNWECMFNAEQPIKGIVGEIQVVTVVHMLQLHAYSLRCAQETFTIVHADQDEC